MSDDVLMQLFVCGPTWDGDLASKSERDLLVRAKLCEREDGWNFLTRLGVLAAVRRGLQAHDWADTRWYRKAANLGPEPTAKAVRAPSVGAHIADTAKSIVSGARRGAYGSPERNFERIARYWTAYFQNTGRDVTVAASDVSPLMRFVKEARLNENPKHLDSFVDLVGYTLTGAETNGVDIPD